MSFLYINLCLLQMKAPFYFLSLSFLYTLCLLSFAIQKILIYKKDAIFPNSCFQITFPPYSINVSFSETDALFWICLPYFLSNLLTHQLLLFTYSKHQHLLHYPPFNHNKDVPPKAQQLHILTSPLTIFSPTLLQLPTLFRPDVRSKSSTTKISI